jgi:uncharacterized protein (DUF983 family)
MRQAPEPLLTTLHKGITGRCPACGEGKLFQGFLKTAPECTHCKLDLDFADSGDGPAIFVIFIVGFIIIAFVAWVELSFMPPLWVHVALWGPSIILLSLAFLRPLKGMMIAMQYRHQAQEGRLHTTDSEE